MTAKERGNCIKEVLSTLTAKEKKFWDHISEFINLKDKPLKKLVKVIKIQGKK